MNANERNEMEKPMEANILPDAVDANVTVTEDEKIIAENNHTNELIENDLIVSEIIEDEEDNEESETDYDFSACNKLQLIEILEETVQDTDVVKIKDKVTAIKSNFLRLNKDSKDNKDKASNGAVCAVLWELFLEDMGLIPESGGSLGEGNGNPRQYSCWENPMDRGAWQVIVHGVSKSWIQLSD